MILNREINLIWYGRGVLADQCTSFDLTSDVAKDAIKYVYSVTTGGSSQSFAENNWSAANVQQSGGGGGFTSLDCGNLYVVILLTGQTIDIPEAVIAHSDEITSVLPNNVSTGDSTDDDDTSGTTPTGTCAPDNLYNALSILGSDITINGETLTITGVSGLIPATNLEILYKGSLSYAGDSQASFEFKIGNSAFFTIDGINILTYDNAIYVEIKGMPAGNGCYKSALDSETSATTITLEAIESEDSSNTGGSDSGSTNTGSNDNTSSATTLTECFHDQHGTGDEWTHKMMYTAPEDADEDTPVNYSNVAVHAKGEGSVAGPSSDAGTPITLPDDEHDNAVKVVNKLIDVAKVNNSRSKHSFVMYFSVFETAGETQYISLTPSDGGDYEGHLLFNATDTGTQEIPSIYAKNPQFKVFVQEGSICLDAIDAPANDGSKVI